MKIRGIVGGCSNRSFSQRVFSSARLKSRFGHSYILISLYLRSHLEVWLSVKNKQSSIHQHIRNSLVPLAPTNLGLCREKRHGKS